MIHDVPELYHLSGTASLARSSLFFDLASARTHAPSHNLIGSPASRPLGPPLPLTGLHAILPPSLTPGALAFLLVSAFIAALARGFSGFGAALIFMPLAATVVDPKVASPLLLITDAVLALGFIPPAFRPPTGVRSPPWGSARRSAFRPRLRGSWSAPTRYTSAGRSWCWRARCWRCSSRAGAIAAARPRRSPSASAHSRACAAAPRKSAARR